MKLCVVEGPSPPEGAEVLALTTSDGLSLRAAFWPAPDTARGTILLIGGRAEFIEKYYEVIDELRQRNFAVMTFDWRGQGLSLRALRNPYKGHIDDFSIFLRDLDAVFAHMVHAQCPRPWFGLAHSMGGAIITHYSLERSVLERIVLCSPLIDLAAIRWPNLAKVGAAVLDFLGAGGAFVPFGARKPQPSGPFEGNPLTSDPLRYERTCAWLRQNPQLGVGAPTIGWVNAAFRLIRQFKTPEYAGSLTTPFLAILAGDDRLVKNSSTEIFTARSRTGYLITLPYSRHEIMMEQDHFRKQFWAAFDAFIPGHIEEKRNANELAHIAAEMAKKSKKRRWFG